MLMHNTVISNVNDSNDDVNCSVNRNVTDKSDKVTLSPLPLEDIRCDHIPVKERLLDIVNEYRHAT